MLHLIKPQRETIRRIPKKDRLYKFISPKLQVQANAATKGTLTLGLAELHHWLEHVAVNTMQEVVQKGLVEGITLDNTDTDDVVYKSYICVKIK